LKKYLGSNCRSESGAMWLFMFTVMVPMTLQGIHAMLAKPK